MTGQLIDRFWMVFNKFSLDDWLSSLSTEQEHPLADDVKHLVDVSDILMESALFLVDWLIFYCLNDSFRCFVRIVNLPKGVKFNQGCETDQKEFWLFRFPYLWYVNNESTDLFRYFINQTDWFASRNPQKAVLTPIFETILILSATLI